MIKYVEYDSIDDNGRHIIPINSMYQLNKTASGSYSPELMKIILNMSRKPNRFYVVVNALGSDEVWGSNRNGDGFPAKGLSHKSLRTDMGTPEDYGYKTFEYYAKLFKHHMNKNHHPNFGEVIYSHWNPVIQRVELIVAIDTITGKDIIDAIESDNIVSVSMGAKVKYDLCSICGNKAPTREKYCSHLKNYMNEIVTSDLADRWSKETGKKILVGKRVYAINDYPRFFDISKVHVGADKTSYILGKAASHRPVLSVDAAEVYGVTDAMIDKLSQVGKHGEMDKNVGSESSDIDGTVIRENPVVAIAKKVDEKIQDTIAAEPEISNDTLDSISKLPLKTIFSTLLGLGIVPKPEEVQRIIIVKIGRSDIADELDRQNEIFDYNDDSDPVDIDFSEDDFSDTLGKSLIPVLGQRSCFPTFLEPRLNQIIVKSANYDDAKKGNYWTDFAGREVKERKINPLIVPALGGLAAIYAGLRLKSLGYGMQQLSKLFMDKPWLRTLIGGGAVWGVASKINSMSDDDSTLNIPASEYANALQNTNFSGHLIKSASFQNSDKMRKLADMVILPGAYIANATKQKALYREGKSIFPEVGGSFNKLASSTIGKNAILTEKSLSDVKKRISALLPTIC